MLVVAAKAGLDPETSPRRLPRVAAIPFSSERQYMATLHRDGDNRHVVLAKGAVERILELCGNADGRRRRAPTAGPRRDRAQAAERLLPRPAGAGHRLRTASGPVRPR